LQLIGLVVIFIYAVLGFQFFSDRAPASFGAFDTSVITLLGVVTTLQPWPTDLPMTIPNEGWNHSASSVRGTRATEIDVGVVCFAFSFGVICILILIQVLGNTGRSSAITVENNICIQPTATVLFSPNL
jgi:hypothetical protein